MSIDCPYCDRTDFASQRALTQHQQKNDECFARLSSALGANSGYTTATEFTPNVQVNVRQKQPDLYANQPFVGKTSAKLGAMQRHFAALPREDQLKLTGYMTAKEDLSEDDVRLRSVLRVMDVIIASL